MLTFFLPTDPEQYDEHVTNAVSVELAVGDLVGSDQVVAVYRYEPIELLIDERVQLAIVHPVGETVPPKEDWYCWLTKQCCFNQTWHIIMYGDRFLRVEPKPAGQIPELDTPLLRFSSNSFAETPRLDKASLTAFMSSIKTLPAHLKRDSFSKFINLNGAPYDSLYVVQTSKIVDSSRVLQTA